MRSGPGEPDRATGTRAKRDQGDDRHQEGLRRRDPSQEEEIKHQGLGPRGIKATIMAKRDHGDEIRAKRNKSQPISHRRK